MFTVGFCRAMVLLSRKNHFQPASADPRAGCIMVIVVYDLAGANPALRFSPYCWCITMALARKGPAVETVP
jgi:hypothetical protein